ncbi:MAG TPA: preprotein translocase subunit SecE [Candidatus Saccharimonadales bacterium]|nr:preprotein translocase subunit SecE [Candidatus Saccharimonadales bacterium]
MATKGKKPATKKAETTTKVTRIRATDDKPAAEKQTKKPVVQEEATEKQARRNPAVAIRDYFVGAWVELKQVRWPNRRATWGMTMAVLAFTAFFVLLILLLDALFKYVFQLILG